MRASRQKDVRSLLRSHPDGRIHFNSINIRPHDGQLIVEFCLNGIALMWMSAPKPNFDAGDTITIADIEGASTIRLD